MLTVEKLYQREWRQLKMVEKYQREKLLVTVEKLYQRELRQLKMQRLGEIGWKNIRGKKWGKNQRDNWRGKTIRWKKMGKNQREKSCKKYQRTPPERRGK